MPWLSSLAKGYGTAASLFGELIWKRALIWTQAGICGFPPIFFIRVSRLVLFEREEFKCR
jgi:hypothetical protein